MVFCSQRCQKLFEIYPQDFLPREPAATSPQTHAIQDGGA